MPGSSASTPRPPAPPGVFAVITHLDVPENRYGGTVQDRLLFAKDTVRWEGDVIAAVAARTPAIARQAAAAIEVTYDVLDPLPDFVANARPGAPLVHPQWSSYTADDAVARDGNVVGRSTLVKGDADAAMAAADVVVKGRYVADASQGAPIEPRALIAEWTGDRVTVWTSTQVPFAARAGIAHTLGIPQSQVRVIVPLLGGGFGSKCDFHFEAHVAALARAARRPVKLVFSRREEFLAPDHRREGMVIELETGASREGTIVARRATLWLDKGAYTGEGGFFAADGRDARLRPLRAREGQGRGAADLLDQPAVELDPGTNGPAGLLGPGAAHGRPRRRARPGPGRAAPAHPGRGRLAGPDRAGVRGDPDEGDARGGPGDDRLRRQLVTCRTTRRSGSPAAGGHPPRRRPVPTSSSTATAPAPS